MLRRMLRFALLVVVILNLFIVGSRAQNRADARRSRVGIQRTSLPRFEDYPAREAYRGRVAPVRLDHRRARMFRSRLREDSRNGPNFAGHYTVVFWGCGTGCAQMAVVDAKTGRVYWPPLEYMDIPDPEGDPARGRGFRLDSKLLVVTRSHYDMQRSFTAFYYLFENNRFRLLRKAEGRDRYQEEPNEEP
ncbi:MAG TPA: hypothetical protein VF666_03570 [Pyrinomonadaceae bacterium]